MTEITVWNSKPFLPLRRANFFHSILCLKAQKYSEDWRKAFAVSESGTILHVKISIRRLKAFNRPLFAHTILNQRFDSFQFSDSELSRWSFKSSNEHPSFIRNLSFDPFLTLRNTRSFQAFVIVRFLSSYLLPSLIFSLFYWHFDFLYPRSIITLFKFSRYFFKVVWFFYPFPILPSPVLLITRNIKIALVSLIPSWLEFLYPFFSFYIYFCNNFWSSLTGRPLRVEAKFNGVLIIILSDCISCLILIFIN